MDDLTDTPPLERGEIPEAADVALVREMYTFTEKDGQGWEPSDAGLTAALRLTRAVEELRDELWLRELADARLAASRPVEEKDIQAVMQEARNALMALRLEVPDAVANSVSELVEQAFLALAVTHLRLAGRAWRDDAEAMTCYDQIVYDVGGNDATNALVRARLSRLCDRVHSCGALPESPSHQQDTGGDTPHE